MRYKTKKRNYEKRINLSLPRGSLANKVDDWRREMEFKLSYFVGPYATGKTKAGVDFCLIHALSYPGAHVGLVRSTLKALKDTTIKDFKSRGGALIHNISENEGLYRLEDPLIHPVTGVPVYSEFSGFGLDKTSDDDWMASLELSALFIDEADTTNRSRRHKLMGRVRHKVYHAVLVVADYAEEMSVRWGISTDEALEILFYDPETNFRDLPPDHPMPGMNQVKMVYNPKGPGGIWEDTFRGVPFPIGGIDEQWVKHNTGVIERHAAADELREDKFRFGAGDIVLDEYGDRYWVKTHDKDEIVTISKITPNGPIREEKRIHESIANLIQQHSVLYAFSWENESRDKNNIRFGYFLDRDIKDKYMHGKVQDENLYVFPNFIEDYVERGGHIVKGMPDSEIARISRTGVGGIDDGIDHACVGVYGFKTRDTGTLVIFKEYISTGRFAHENSVNIANGVPIGEYGRLDMVWGYDPAMRHRQSVQASDYGTPKDIYQQQLPSMMPGANGDAAFQHVVRLLERKPVFYKNTPPFGMLVMDTCPEVIECLKTLTWEMVRNVRGNYLVDVGDALKYGCSVYTESTESNNVSIITPSRVGVGEYA